MSDLAYDKGDLQSSARMLEQAVDIARRVDRDAGRMAGEVSDCGHERLSGVAKHFLEEWGYGMKIIAEDADGLATGLREAITAYEAVDQNLAASLRQAG